MATEKRQKVRFTGKRTGLESITIKGIGPVSAGQQIEVPLEQAERWTQPLPTGDGKEASDFALVGEPFSVDEDEGLEHTLAQREKFIEAALASVPDETEKEPKPGAKKA